MLRRAVWASGLGAALLAAAPTATADLTYTIGGSWPNAAHRAAADNAMQAVVDRYNAYGDFGNHDVYAYYNAGIPTAQASYLGSIGFGGTYPAERVTQHEMAHYLGLPSGSYASWMSDGRWDGALGNAKVRQFDGEDATLNGDGIHFWPYGLNYDSEGSEINKQRQVAVVYAMRGDLGIGSAAHPASSRRGVVLTGDDPVGQSGFNYADRWSDGYFAHAVTPYSTGDYKLRTPASTARYRFYGGSLTIDNANGAGGGLLYAGQGTGAEVTVDNLRLDGGWVQHASSFNSPFRLHGAVDVLSDSTFCAKQGDIDVHASLSGAANLTVALTDSPDQDARYVRFHAPDNTFTGGLVNESRFELAEGANFRFAIGAPGVSNAITGAAARATRLNGVFDLDLSSAGSGAGDAWTLVSAANTTYGETFRVDGFLPNAGAWSDGAYAFSQASGQLTTVPTWTHDGGGAWSQATNWRGGAIPSAGGEGTLGPALGAPNAPAVVGLDTPVAVRRLTFDSPNPYTLNGSNQLTLTGGAQLVAKQGAHVVGAPIAGDAGLEVHGPGTVTLTAANPYSGATRVASGVLALGGGGSIANSSSVEVAAGATLDASAASGGFVVSPGQTLRVGGGEVVGAVNAAGSAAIEGVGLFRHNVALQAGASLRVGGAGLPSAASLSLIDDFQYFGSTTTIGAHSSGDATAGAWDGVQDGTSNARIVTQRRNGSLQVYGLGSDWRGAVTDLSANFDADHSLADGDTATYFVQFYREGTGAIDGLFGLVEDTTTLDTTDAWRDFSVMGVVAGGDAGSTSFAVHGENGTGGEVLASVAANTWHNVWFVVDNAAKEFDVYTSTGDDAAQLALSGVEFGRITDPVDLDAFGLAEQLSGSNPASAALRIDNLAVTPGVSLLHPLHGPQGVYHGETLTFEGDLTLADGSAVSLDIADDGVSDSAAVGGALTLGGLLRVERETGLPTLAAGNRFVLFEFATAAGRFDAFDLPELGDALTWDVSALGVDGSLVVADALVGDYNGDGVVDAADYVVWRDAVGQDASALWAGSRSPTGAGSVGAADYDAWRANYGATRASATLAVPEPSALLLLLAAAGARATRRR